MPATCYARTAAGLDDAELETTFGTRTFASGDRLIFRRNDRTMDVRNSTIGAVTGGRDGSMRPQKEFDRTAFPAYRQRFCRHLASRAGRDPDSLFVLATRGLDRHLSYVACTRHRDRPALVHSRDACAKDGLLAATLGCEHAKDTTHD